MTTDNPAIQDEAELSRHMSTTNTWLPIGAVAAIVMVATGGAFWLGGKVVVIDDLKPAVEVLEGQVQRIHLDLTEAKRDRTYIIKLLEAKP